jgi:phosphomannomutase/phosphoglucomutase
MNRGMASLYGPEIKEIGEMCVKGDFLTGEGSETQYDPIPDYINTVTDRIHLKRKMRVALDCGNATGGTVAPQLLKKLGCEVTELFCELDGTFPNHHPDPTVIKNLTEIRKKVRDENLDMGIALDGDSDRIGVVDETSTPIFGDMILLIYARDLLKRHPGTPVVFEVKCSQILIDEIEKAGGIPVMGQAGHSLIKKRMKEENALLAGEMSGHMFFAENYFGYDDAIYAAAKLLEIVSNANTPLSGYLKNLPVAYSTPEIRIDCPDEKKFEIVRSLTEEFRKDYPIIDIDGVRITFPQGWGLVRPSNTQPVLVLRFESYDEAELKKYQNIMLQKLKPFNLEFKIQ